MQKNNPLMVFGLSLLPVVVPSILLKAWYSGSDAWGLQWILQPLAALTGIVTGLSFVPGESGEWINYEKHIAIVKSCAGVNFMVLSLLIYMYGGIRHAQSRTGITRTVFCYISVVLASLFAAWYTTLLVNALRIGLAVHLYLENFTLPGLGSSELHLIAGILVYFPALWLQCRLCCSTSLNRAGPVALSGYLGMVIVIPVLSGNFLDDPARFLWHTMVTVMTSLVIVGMSRTPGLVLYIIHRHHAAEGLNRSS